LAGAIVLGVARFIVMLSAHADVFGVGITAIVGLILVSPSCVTSCRIVPGGGLVGISGVESGKAAPLPGRPPGIELQTMVEGAPSGDVGGTLPVVVSTIGVGMAPNGAAGVIAVGDIIAADVGTPPNTIGDDIDTGGGTVEGDGVAGDVANSGDGRDVTVTACVPGAICGIGVAQITTVPGVVGSEARGTGANVVSGTPGWVVAENGLGP
jgi:hypothetical protein